MAGWFFVSVLYGRFSKFHINLLNGTLVNISCNPHEHLIAGFSCGERITKIEN